MKVKFTNFNKEFLSLEKELIKSFRAVGNMGDYIIGNVLEIFEN